MYLYGLVHRSAIEHLKSLSIAGIAHELVWIESGELGAIVEPGFPVQACAVSEQALIDAIVIHDRVLLSAFAVTTVLPLRFGTEFASDDALLEHLKTQQSAYLKAIKALESQAEVSLKLFAQQAEPEPIPTTLKGRDYFLAKKEQSQQQQLFQQSFDRDRQSLIEEFQFHNIQIFTKSVDHYLLLCDRTCDLALYLKCWQSQNQWTWKLSELLPPYHFATEILSL
jgi:hypothetical protein